MVISEQARRSWRLAAIIGSIGVGIQAVLFTDYDIPGQDPNKKHVFSDIQASFRVWKNQYLPSSDNSYTNNNNNHNNHNDDKK